MAYVSETNLDRCRRNCRLGRLSLTGPLPGGASNLAEGTPGDIERKALEATDLQSMDWNVKKIPRLSSSGTRRPLCVPFSDFTVEEATEVSPSAEVSKRWEEGASEGERWSPEGTSLRLVFTLPPGTYATVLMREFMRSPLDHY
jgi:tRNA pseudouridine13 synthase